MKISQDHWIAATDYRGSESGIRLRQALYPAQRASFSRAAWQFTCRLAASLEVFTLVPVAAIIVTAVLIYRVVTRGFYEVIFNSKR